MTLLWSPPALLLSSPKAYRVTEAVSVCPYSECLSQETAPPLKPAQWEAVRDTAMGVCLPKAFPETFFPCKVHFPSHLPFLEDTQPMFKSKLIEPISSWISVQ